MQAAEMKPNWDLMHRPSMRLFPEAAYDTGIINVFVLFFSLFPLVQDHFQAGSEAVKLFLLILILEGKKAYC